MMNRDEFFEYLKNEYVEEEIQKFMILNNVEDWLIEAGWFSKKISQLVIWLIRKTAFEVHTKVAVQDSVFLEQSNENEKLEFN